MTEYGLFNDEAENWTAEQAVEADFFSIAEASEAMRKRYLPEDDLFIHEIEEPDDEDDGDDND